MTPHARSPIACSSKLLAVSSDPMKRIVVCCDGTWNSPERRGVAPSNVVKLARAVRPVASDGTPQVVFYDAGVGTDNFFDRITGGAFGVGLGRNVREAYRFILHNFEEGDEIYIFGFSRGAFTARSTGGFLRNVGLLHKLHADRVHEAWDLYRKRDDSADTQQAVDFRNAYSRYPVKIRLIGVWDTVGALGIPGLLNFIGRRRFAFHDVRLSRGVEFAFHAAGVDEKRRFFKPTLWEQHPEAANQVMEQKWFPGVHADIGGGYNDSSLAEGALGWIIEGARRAGLEFDSIYLDQVCTPDHRGALHESHTGPYKLIPAFHRPIGKGVQRDKPSPEPVGPSNESLHDFTRRRYEEDRSYRPPELVKYIQSQNP